MKRFASVLLPFAILCVMALPAAADDAKTYSLKLSRKPKVGETSHERFKITSEQSQKLTLNGKKLKSETEDLKADLDCTVEVQEVTPHGKPAKIKVTVQSFSVQKDEEAPESPFKAGAILLSSLDKKGKQEFSADGAKVTGPAEKVLKSLLTMNADRENDVDDDIIFATNQPRKPGDQWDVNRAELIKSLPDDVPFKLAEKDISGKVSMPSVKAIDGKDHCLLKAEVKITPSGVKNLPETFEATRTSLTITVEKLVPEDEKAATPFEKQTQEMILNGTIDSPSGKVLMETYAREQKENESGPAK